MNENRINTSNTVEYFTVYGTDNQPTIKRLLNITINRNGTIASDPVIILGNKFDNYVSKLHFNIEMDFEGMYDYKIAFKNNNEYYIYQLVDNDFWIPNTLTQTIGTWQMIFTAFERRNLNLDAIDKVLYEGNNNQMYFADIQTITPDISTQMTTITISTNNLIEFPWNSPSCEKLYLEPSLTTEAVFIQGSLVVPSFDSIPRFLYGQNNKTILVLRTNSEDWEWLTPYSEAKLHFLANLDANNNGEQEIYVSNSFTGAVQDNFLVKDENHQFIWTDTE